MSSLLDFEDKPFSELTDDEDLLHYGILGMKWGVRRDRWTLDRLAGRETSEKKTAVSNVDTGEKPKSSGPSDNANERPKSNAQVRRDRKAAKQDRRELELKDLKDRLERFKLETELAKLTNDDLAPARTFMARIAKDIARETLTNVGKTISTGLLIYTVRALLEKKWDPAEAAKYLMPKKK